MPLTVASTMVKRVSVYKYKILGVMVNSDLKWDDHVTAIMSKARKRLVYETVEKSRRFSRRLMFYYQSVVRPVLEYACLCWHLNLTRNWRNNLRTFNVVRFTSFSVTCRVTKYVVHVTFRH